MKARNHIEFPLVKAVSLQSSQTEGKAAQFVLNLPGLIPKSGTF